MENATKALLIAAAVLIAIVLVALGVNLLNAGEDTSGQAENVANAIGNKIDGVSDSIISTLSGPVALDDKAFNEYIKKNYTGIRTGAEIKKLCKLIIEKYGSLYKNSHAHISSQNGPLYSYDAIEENIDSNKKYEITWAEEGETYLTLYVKPK